jgi:stage V sporulation protein T
MKATGIVRRIDDLGRVVIPKEIRRRMGIHENDPLEIFISEDGKGIVFQKYNTDENASSLLKQAIGLLEEDSSDNQVYVAVLRTITEQLEQKG